MENYVTNMYSLCSQIHACSLCSLDLTEYSYYNVNALNVNALNVNALNVNALNVNALNKRVNDMVETEKLEFKEIVTDDIYKGVVAFANADGGTILVGMNKQGEAAGGIRVPGP